MQRIQDKARNRALATNSYSPLIESWCSLRENVDILADVHFYSTSEGGRRTPARSGLGCIMTIDDTNLNVRLYFNAELVYSGQTAKAGIRFMNPSLGMQHCSVGKKFMLKELRITAVGSILEVIRYVPPV